MKSELVASEEMDRLGPIFFCARGRNGLGWEDFGALAMVGIAKRG